VLYAANLRHPDDGNLESGPITVLEFPGNAYIPKILDNVIVASPPDEDSAWKTSFLGTVTDINDEEGYVTVISVADGYEYYIDYIYLSKAG
jgi:hypothetical protein